MSDNTRYAIMMRYADGHGRKIELPAGTTREQAEAAQDKYQMEADSGSRHTPACGASEVNLLESKPIWQTVR